ncbi:MAG: FkbM family methyltransferase [Alphaproteobacteria bacterium]|nr:FkbM family methyltransferase [Alphaproteobacteria bacterium]
MSLGTGSGHHPQNEIITIAVQPRKFITEIAVPFLPRLQLHDPDYKPRGFHGLKKKLGRAADDVLHGWMKLPARGTFTVSMADGISHDLAFDAHQSAYLAFVSRELHGGYEPTETLFLEAMLAKANSFFDVGANWGYYSLLAATHKQYSGKIFAFDVSGQMNFALTSMAESLALNSLEVVGCGLSDQSGNVVISAAEATHLTKIIGAENGQVSRVETAKVTTLDDIELPAPDLMKIDVEDHEIEVFRGGKTVLTQHKPLILFENRSGRNGGKAGNFLQTLGYNLYYLTSPVDADSTINLVPLNLAELAEELVNYVAVPAGQEAHWFE